MRISEQMRNILLTLLKAERDLTSVVGERKAKHHWRNGGKLDQEDLRQFIETPHTVKEAFGTKLLTYLGGFDTSYNRSLNKLTEWGLVNVLRITSPGRHGYLYQLTDKGRTLADGYLKQIKDYIQENQKFL